MVDTCVSLIRSVSCSANGSWRGQVYWPVVRAQHSRPGSQVCTKLHPSHIFGEHGMHRCTWGVQTLLRPVAKGHKGSLTLQSLKEGPQR